MIAAVPYRYSGARLEILWLVDVEALLIAAWRLSEKYLRKLGWAGAAVLTTYVWLHDVMPRVDQWRPPDAKLGWMFLLLAAALFVDGWLKTRVGEDWGAVDRAAFVLAPICANRIPVGGGMGGASADVDGAGVGDFGSGAGGMRKEI